VAKSLGDSRNGRAILVPLIESRENPPAIQRLLDALVILEAYPDPIPPRERIRLSYLVRRCLDAIGASES